MIRAAILTAALATATGAQAAAVRDCDTFEANARNLVLPVEEGVRTFANGNVRLLHLDTGGEPACCSAHLMVLLPDPELPGQICVLISADDRSGFYAIDLPGTKAAYDPATGLSLDVPVALHDGTASTPRRLRLRINQQTGVVDATQEDMP